MKTGAYLGAKKVRWSSCDRSSCPLVEHSMEECLFVITPPPLPPTSLPAWQLSQTPLPLPSGAQRTERPEWENSNIYNFFPFSFHRLIFQEGLSLLYRRAERGIESRVGVGCRGVGGCGRGGGLGLQCKRLLTFSFFFS